LANKRQEMIIKPPFATMEKSGFLSGIRIQIGVA
jgi:hypothetical protein